MGERCIAVGYPIRLAGANHALLYVPAGINPLCRSGVPSKSAAGRMLLVKPKRGKSRTDLRARACLYHCIPQLDERPLDAALGKLDRAKINVAIDSRRCAAERSARICASTRSGDTEAAKNRNLEQIHQDAEDNRGGQFAKRHRGPQGLNGDASRGQGCGDQHIGHGRNHEPSAGAR